MLRRKLPKNKSLFVTIGSVAICFAAFLAMGNADGPKLGHAVLGTIGTAVLLLGVFVREESLAVLASWLLLLNVAAAVVSFIATL